MYVQYQPDNGKILSITNVKPEFDYIEVDIEDVKDIHSGKESSHKFQVLYDNLQGKFYLNKKDVDNVFEKTIDFILYEIPIIDDRKGITIIQDTKNSCWKFLISQSLEIDFKNNNSFTNYNLYFSVTEFGNPNILFKQLAINLDQLVKNHYQIISFTSDFEKNNKLVSIYTNKRFEYNFERS